MKIGFGILLITVSCFAQGQLTSVPLRTANAANSGETAVLTLTLPFWDDFSTSGSSLDTARWQYGFDVYVNNGLALNAPTYKVATLDGLNGNGIAYNITGEFNTITDSLVSQNIDLSDYTAADQIYFSFFWQAGGLGELPDDLDTLSLHFLGSDGRYRQVWSTSGSTPADQRDQFFPEILPLHDTSFFHSDFRFKFQSYALPTGPFDVWNLDYIYLDHSRNLSDTLFQDRAISMHPSRPFGNYHSIPAYLFFKEPAAYFEEQSLSVVNLDDASSPLAVQYRVDNLTTSETYFDQAITGLPSAIAPMETLSITSPSDIIIPAQGTPLDSQVIRLSFYLTSEDSVFLKRNDTIRSEYLLHNFYAYDDGTAEFGAGVNVNQAKLAQRFILAETDTLTHIDIHFPSIDPSSEGSTINITVWSNLKPERVLSTLPYTIASNSQPNEFKRIKLASPRLVGDTIYVGFQQLVSEFIAVGFDKNNVSASHNIWSKTNSEWIQNDRLQGVLMIRPVFGSDSTFTLAAKPKFNNELQLFPNPSRGTFSIKGSYEYLEVYDLSGTCIYNSEYRNRHSIDNRTGIYLVKLYNDERPTTLKLVIQ